MFQVGNFKFLRIMRKRYICQRDSEKTKNIYMQWLTKRSQSISAINVARLPIPCLGMFLGWKHLLLFLYLIKI